MRLLAPLLFACAFVALPGCQDGGSGPSGGAAIERFVVAQPALTESSGLARSGRSPGVYWSHNDSGGPTDLYAFDAQGAARGVLHVQGALNLDWEDISGFVEDGVPRLLVADVGDNSALRPAVRLYVLDEPALDAAGAALETRVSRSFALVYPDGPRDCEAVAVDAEEGSVYLLSKRDAVPRLYRVPLHPGSPLVVAEALGEIAIPRAAADAPDPESINWVTSMDFAADARRAAVVTLRRAYVYTRAEGESWAQAFARPPKSYAVPDDPQIEAIAWSADAGELLLTSEGEPTPAARLRVD